MTRRFLYVGASLATVAATPHIAAQDVSKSRQTAIVTAASRLAPAVVSVNVLRRERQLPQDPFDQFFMPRGSEQVVEGYGSGFLISPDGVVITNQHVTQGAEQIVVTTREGRDFPAKMLGEDPLTDIAVLKVDGSNLPTAPIGKSTDLMTGEWVVAIGNPFATTHSPVMRSVLFPIGAVGRLDPSTLRTAMSVSGSSPSILAGKSRPSRVVTTICSAPCVTCWLVITTPSGEMMKPDP